MFEKKVTYRLKKVSFPETDSAVNEKRIVFSAGIFRDGLCGSEGKLIGFTLYERVESVFLTERRGFRFFLSRGAVDNQSDFGNGIALLLEVFRFFVLDYDFHIGDEGVERHHDVFYKVEITGVDGLFGRGGSRGQNECVVHETNRLQFFYPDLVTDGLHRLLEFVFHVVPKIFFPNHSAINYNKTT